MTWANKNSKQIHVAAVKRGTKNNISDTRRSVPFDVHRWTPTNWYIKHEKVCVIWCPNTKKWSAKHVKKCFIAWVQILGQAYTTQMVEVFNFVIIYYQTCFNQNGDYTLTDHSLDSSWHFILKYALAFSFLYQSCQLGQAVYPSGRRGAWARGNWRWWRRRWARPEKNTPVIIVSI